jgi:putative ABC transport system permease protein
MIAQLPGVAAVSPAVEVELLPGRAESIKVLGLDVLRAGAVQPALVADLGLSMTELFDPDAVFISPQAAEQLGLKPGDPLGLQIGVNEVRLRVAGLLGPGTLRQRAALMDIAGAQWRLDRVGTLNRIDIRAEGGTDLGRLRASIEALLPAGVQVVAPDEEVQRGATLSRAYRVNLNMLALVALFTGGFPFSTRPRGAAASAALPCCGAGATPRAESSAAARGWRSAPLPPRACDRLIRGAPPAKMGGDLGAGYFQGSWHNPKSIRSPCNLLRPRCHGRARRAAVPAFGAARRRPPRR